MHVGEVTKISSALLILIIFVPGLLSSFFWILAKNVAGRKRLLVLIFALHLLINVALPIAGGIRYLVFLGDEGQIVGLVLAVGLFRALELFSIFSTGGAKAVWNGGEP